MTTTVARHQQGTNNSLRSEREGRVRTNYKVSERVSINYNLRLEVRRVSTTASHTQLQILASAAPPSKARGAAIVAQGMRSGKDAAKMA